MSFFSRGQSDKDSKGGKKKKKKYVFLGNFLHLRLGELRERRQRTRLPQSEIQRLPNLPRDEELAAELAARFPQLVDNKEASGRRSRVMTKPREMEVTFADRKLSEEYQAITELISDLKRSRHSIKEIKKKRKPTGPVFGVSLEVAVLTEYRH